MTHTHGQPERVIFACLVGGDKDILAYLVDVAVDVGVNRSLCLILRLMSGDTTGRWNINTKEIMGVDEHVLTPLDDHV